MKEKLVAAMENIKEDAEFWVRFFSNDGTFRSEKKPKEFVDGLLKHADDARLHEYFDKVVVIDGIGVSLDNFDENIYYETTDIEGYMGYVSKYNKYYKVYIKLDKENKTISFKLGEKSKTLILIEDGEYVSRPYKRKYMQCVSAEQLERHINDEWWNPRMVEIGRRVLGIKSIIAA